MSSNINPNNIDGTYPVAGQDNNSQGFRDNFTNTKTNFQYAKDEITDLQNKAILKAALTGTTLDNNMLGSILSNAQLQDMAYTYVNLGTQSGSVGINYAAGPYQIVTTSGSINLAFTNWPAAGVTGFINVGVNITNKAHTVTFPAAVSVNNTGLIGLDPATNIFTAPAPGFYGFGLLTSNGGSSIGLESNANQLVPFNNSSEDLGASAAASLGVTTSYFTTSAAETATLAAGVEGQIKVFAMKGDSGDMVITVANPAWGGAGTITFSAVGQACTLQYISGQWFCIGNNGAAFA